MKILGIFFFIYLLNLGVVFIVDRLAGLQLSKTLRNIEAPFQTMTFPEYVIVFALLSTLFVPPIYSFFKKRK